MGKHSEHRHLLGRSHAPGSRGGTASDGADGSRGVAVRGIGVTYGEVRALRGVSLTALPGQFVAVTGHSGAGKTSLINAIAGIVPLAAGEVDLGQGAAVKRDPRAVAIIPQGNGLASVLTAYENVLAPLRARGHDPTDAAERANAALAAVGLGESGTHLIEEPERRSAAARRGGPRARHRCDRAPRRRADERASTTTTASGSSTSCGRRPTPERSSSWRRTTPRPLPAPTPSSSLDDGEVVAS